MKKLLLQLFTVALCGSTFAQRPEIVPGQLIVQLREGASIDHVLQDNAVLNGKATDVQHMQFLSPPMRIHLLAFDPQTDHNALLRQVLAHPAVSEAQFNHVVAFRETVPNDPQFNQQWQHQNTGANGGTAGADVDSPLAWDITTGGVTALGDTIVVCIVDDGTNYGHPDLVDNLWKNHNEIPDNNVDDDGNGYVDDYYGWNASNGSPEVGNGGHGINVAGMVGAKGNNNLGVVGVNWNVKLMTVVNGSIGGGGSPNEANVIAAYTYPLIMRQRYHATGGEEGAFVVATNSSWGIDNGNPDNAPLWCAFYDTLGAYGILSAGATANAQINVDVNGDLPTGCASDFMISVTATNNNDVRTFSGYGLTTIDLGAPGEAVRTTSGSNGYTTTDGTSFASPMVAGAIALLYSAPCPSLAAIAHADPQLAAQLVRQYLLGGVDVVDDLIGYTVTGGRLNLRNALDLLLTDCQDAGCIGALNVTVSGISATAATLNWTGLEQVLSFDVRYGAVGADDTVGVAGVTAPFLLEGLDACTQYWVSLRSQCETDSSGWGNDRLFTTDGCCEPPAMLAVSDVNEASATAQWGPVLAAQSYLLQWRAEGASGWQELAVTGTDTTIGPLDGCTWYETRVATVCDTGITAFIATDLFRTRGCGDCIDIAYCASEGVTTFEWIGSVSIGDLTNVTGASGGYADFTDLVIDLHRDSAYGLTLSPAFEGATYREHFRIWVDLNRNGVFSASELLFDDTQGSTTTVTGSLTIPLNADLGAARMRVSMAYGSPFGGDYPQTACETGQDGEVEDYCVNILEEFPDDTTGIGEAVYGVFGISVFPVPAADVLQVRLLNGVSGQAVLRVADMQGRAVMRMVLAGDRHQLDVSELNPGVYVIEAIGTEGLLGRARFVRR
ncbi:MAG: S8 family serine peptidase [Flavobacteriales bacterium]|nr:S8 family serine peptidase [Flavobacteriales bacterium]